MEFSRNFCGLSVSLFASAFYFSSGRTRCCMVIHNQTRAALARQERPHPLDENADSEIGRGKKLDMDSGPGEPSKESAQMDFTALQNGKAFPHNCHIALIEVPERSQGRFPFDPPPNQLPCVTPLLHGDLSDAGQRLAVLL